ncbi:MAG: diaminopimelate epimerase [Oscillospiraceae bacterium]|nr:diaminopimelate epimerase [Oscillospiraceae bacterium]
MLSLSKYHGCGNDFMILREKDAAGYDLNALIPAVCDRHTGIGADGLILVRETPLTMLFYNCDGSRAPMCGNGIRCFAKFCLDEGIVDTDCFDVETLAGIKTVTVKSREPFMARVAMGRADFSPESVGVKAQGPALDFPVPVEGRQILVDSFFMSTVHTVLFVDDPEAPETQRIAGIICESPLYREKTNVNLVRVLDRKQILMRTWERGVGMTLACGTGACAAALDAYRKGYCENEVEILLPKGRLTIQINEDGDVWMSGPAERIIKGEYDL